MIQHQFELQYWFLMWKEQNSHFKLAIQMTSIKSPHNFSDFEIFFL